MSVTCHSQQDQTQRWHGRGSWLLLSVRSRHLVQERKMVKTFLKCVSILLTKGFTSIYVFFFFFFVFPSISLQVKTCQNLFLTKHKNICMSLFVCQSSKLYAYNIDFDEVFFCIYILSLLHILEFRVGVG